MDIQQTMYTGTDTHKEEQEKHKNQNYNQIIGHCKSDQTTKEENFEIQKLKKNITRNKGNKI